MEKVLFLCTGNSCRSQMAEAFVNHLFGHIATACSAGTEPRPVHPLAVKVMKELGIDISHQHSKPQDTFKEQDFDLVITLCSKAVENCSLNIHPGRRFHAGFADPAQKQGTDEDILAEFRIVRDAIQIWLENFFEKIH